MYVAVREAVGEYCCVGRRNGTITFPAWACLVSLCVWPSVYHSSFGQSILNVQSFVRAYKAENSPETFGEHEGCNVGQLPLPALFARFYHPPSPTHLLILKPTDSGDGLC